MRITLYKSRKKLAPYRFVVTFDEYGIIDTIERDGQALVSTSTDARKIIRGADRLRDRIAPKGFWFA